MRKINFLIIAFLLCILASCVSTPKTPDNENNLFRILVGEKYGFINESGRIIIEPQFDDANRMFTEGVCYARIGERKGLIDETGSFIVEYADSVQNVSKFQNGFSQIDCGFLKKGIININKEYILPAHQYDVWLEEDGDSLYFNVIGPDFNWYIADKKGGMIGSICDSILGGFCNGLCAVKKNGQWGYMNRNGKLVIDTVYDFARVFTEDGIARVRKGKEEFFIDKNGHKLFDVEHHLTGFNCNRAAVIMNGEKCIVDRAGKKICSIDADKIRPFDAENNMAVIIKDGHASIIDTMGNTILNTHYEDIGYFIGGVAPVMKDNKIGFIDMSGTEIISPSFEIYTLHKKEYAIRALANYESGVWAYSYYDLQGNLIWKDAPTNNAILPSYPERKDFVDYFDTHLDELDPIEGIYYVTIKNYYQDRDNPSSIGSNDTESTFYAIAKNKDIDGYMAYLTDGSGKHWVNKFVKIGETNNYGILKIDKDNNYSSEGRVAIDDPTQFDFRLEQGHNNYYNFFVTYEFVKDYPPASEYEKVMKAEWSGSGFAIADGFIATNYHVTSGAKTIRVKGINGNFKESFSGFVVASDKEHDIAIIKIVDKDFESIGEIPYTIGKSSVDVGDDVFVLGYPMNTTMGDEVKLTEGIISSLSGFKGDDSMYQISAAVQPGNSGGPLFNADGTVVGIICGKHADAENANYAIKVSYLYSLVTSSNLGITLSDNNRVKGKRLSNKVKKVKDYVYLIECRSK